MLDQKLIGFILLCLFILAGCSSNQEETETHETKIATEQQVNTPCNIIELEYEKIERVIEDSNFRQTPFTIFKTDDLEIRTMSFGGWDNFYKLVSKNSSSHWMEFNLADNYSQDYAYLYIPRIYKNTESKSYYFTHFANTEECDRLVIKELTNGQIVNCFETYPNEKGYDIFVNGDHNDKFKELFRQNQFIACSSDSFGFKVITAIDSSFSDKYFNISKESKEEYLKYHSLQPSMIRLLDSLDQEIIKQKPKTKYTLQKNYYENEPRFCTFDIESKIIKYSADDYLGTDTIFFVGDTLRILSTYSDSPGQEDDLQTNSRYDFVYSRKYQELVLDKYEVLKDYIVVGSTGDYAIMSPGSSKEVSTRNPYNRLTFQHFAMLYSSSFTSHPLSLEAYHSE